MEFALPTDSTEATGLSLLRRLWVAKFDVEEEGRALAEKYVFLDSDLKNAISYKMCFNSWTNLFACFFLLRLLESLALELVPELCCLLIGDVTHHEEAIRSAAADALSSAVSEYKDQSANVLGQLTELYQKKLYVRPWGISKSHYYLYCSSYYYWMNFMS